MQNAECKIEGRFAPIVSGCVCGGGLLSDRQGNNAPTVQFMTARSIHDRPLSLFALQKSSSPFSGANVNSCRKAIHFCRELRPRSSVISPQTKFRSVGVDVIPLIELFPC